MELTTRFSSTSTPGSETTSEPVAIRMLSAFQRPRLAAVFGRYRDRIGGRDLTMAEDMLDLVLLEQKGDALGQVVDDLVLALEHGRQIGLDAVRP